MRARQIIEEERLPFVRTALGRLVDGNAVEKPAAEREARRAQRAGINVG